MSGEIELIYYFILYLIERSAAAFVSASIFMSTSLKLLKLLSLIKIKMKVICLHVHVSGFA